MKKQFNRALESIMRLDVKNLSKLIAKTPGLLSAKDESGQTLLLKASLMGNINAVAKLVEKGADPDAADATGDTPLIEASLSGNLHVVSVLLSAGAAVNRQNHQGETALAFAIVYGHRNICALLASEGADVNLPDNNGNTPLSLAVEERDMQIVELMLNNGADPNCMIYGKSAYYFAIKNGCYKIAKRIFESAAFSGLANDERKKLLVVVKENAADFIRLIKDQTTRTNKIKGSLYCAGGRQARTA